jgi:hypothetical protein
LVANVCLTAHQSYINAWRASILFARCVRTSLRPTDEFHHIKAFTILLAVMDYPGYIRMLKSAQPHAPAAEIARAVRLSANFRPMMANHFIEPLRSLDR